MFSVNLTNTGIKLNDAISKKNIPVKYIAIELGISLNAVYKWMKGKSVPDIAHLYQLSKILNTPMEDLIEIEQLQKKQ